jgi:hypothetical protein
MQRIGGLEGLVRKEEWEEALRVLEKAFEESGRSRRDVSSFLSPSKFIPFFVVCRSTKVCSVHRKEWLRM